MRKKKINPTPEQLSYEEFGAVYIIEHCTIRSGRPPTIRDMAQMLKLSVSATMTSYSG